MSKMFQEQADMLKLPNELVSYIAAMLWGRDLYHFALSCKSVHAACVDRLTDTRCALTYGKWWRMLALYTQPNLHSKMTTDMLAGHLLYQKALCQVVCFVVGEECIAEGEAILRSCLLKHYGDDDERSRLNVKHILLSALPGETIVTVPSPPIASPREVVIVSMDHPFYPIFLKLPRPSVTIFLDYMRPGQVKRLMRLCAWIREVVKDAGSFGDRGLDGYRPIVMEDGSMRAYQTTADPVGEK